MARALYIGYEVGPTFRCGDWMVWDEHGSEKIVCKITGDDECRDDNVMTDHKAKNGHYQSLPKEWLRPATPQEIQEEKERRLFAKYGRKPWELKVGDILKNDIGNLVRVTEINELVSLKSYGFSNTYALCIKKIAKSFRVVCFADDRKDIDND